MAGPEELPNVVAKLLYALREFLEQNERLGGIMEESMVGRGPGYYESFLRFAVALTIRDLCALALM